MADGSHKPIEDLKTGDKVIATDPITGRTEAKPIIATITSKGDKNLVQVTVNPDAPRRFRASGDEPPQPTTKILATKLSNSGVIIATDTHPFWVAGDLNAWVEATDLKPGMWLRTSAGTHVQITATEHRTAHHQRVHNLTIANHHTYHVLAEETPVLVHNSDDCPPETLFHYTDEAGMNGIVESKKLNASTKEVSPKDAHHGDGQYLSDIAPGTRTCAQLSRCFLKHPFSGRRFSNYVEIDVRGLNVVKGRNNVYVIPNKGPLDLNGRIVGYGAN